MGRPGHSRSAGHGSSQHQKRHWPSNSLDRALGQWGINRFFTRLRKPWQFRTDTVAEAEKNSASTTASNNWKVVKIVP